jgi:hypothetical protein
MRDKMQLHLNTPTPPFFRVCASLRATILQTFTPLLAAPRTSVCPTTKYTDGNLRTSSENFNADFCFAVADWTAPSNLERNTQTGPRVAFIHSFISPCSHSLTPAMRTKMTLRRLSFCFAGERTSGTSVGSLVNVAPTEPVKATPPCFGSPFRGHYDELQTMKNTFGCYIHIEAGDRASPASDSNHNSPSVQASTRRAVESSCTAVKNFIPAASPASCAAKQARGNVKYIQQRRSSRPQYLVTVL